MKEINIAKTLIVKRREKGLRRMSWQHISVLQKRLFQNGKQDRAIRILPFFLNWRHILISATMN